MSIVPASAAFSPAASSYDALRRKLVPCFHDFYGSAIALICDWHRQGDPLRILDLGAGTGLMSALVLERVPQAEVCLSDASDQMLEEARKRFSTRSNVKYVLADMVNTDLGGPWDLVISGLAIHHLEHVDKRSLFSRIHTALRPAGLFVNAEQVLGSTSSLEARYHRLWRAEVAERGADDAEIDRTIERMAFDRCATPEEQLSWMRDSRFVDVDCSFKSGRFAVLTGRA